MATSLSPLCLRATVREPVEVGHPLWPRSYPREERRGQERGGRVDSGRSPSPLALSLLSLICDPPLSPFLPFHLEQEIREIMKERRGGGGGKPRREKERHKKEKNGCWFVKGEA